MADMLIGLIGGTGIGQALQAELDGESLELDTPFGRPSGPIRRGQWEGAEIAFLPRHGPHHTIPPSIVPYRANIYALKAIGVTHIVASGATGSLREEIRPRDLVICDQVIDRTFSRVSTYFDRPGLAAHVEFASPFCPVLRAILLDSNAGVPCTVHDGGTYVCMEGPAFSTMAESRMHRALGGDLIGMTCMPEAKLAREAEMCYALAALPTDYDCWRPHDPGLDRAALLHEIVSNIEHATHNSVMLLRNAVARLASGVEQTCGCKTALDLAIWTRPEHISDEIRGRLGPILQRRLSGSDL